jgi:4-carboxymuconolactone decarboxylase
MENMDVQGRSKPPKPYREFKRGHPAVADAYEQLATAVRAAGPLTAREVALVKLGISMGARMEGAVHSHVRKALDDGVEPEAVEHVAVLTCPTIGFPNMMAALVWVRDVLGDGTK